jgi:hypothetical protein
LLTFCLIAFSQTGSGSLEIKQKNRTIGISVIKRVTQQYYLLTRNKPLELTIAGPNWLRVYTRLLFKPEMKDKGIYKIIVSEGEEERIVSLETEKSNSATGPTNQEFGKWRSFFIEVPKGVNNYKFSLWQAPSETVAIRFNIEKPKEWKSLTPDQFQKKLIADEAGKTTDYYELGLTEPTKLQFEGPLRLKIATRLNYDITMEGAQKFTIVVLENDKELQQATFRVSKSETVKYQNKTEVIPSAERLFYLQIPAGKHQLEFRLTETLAKSAGLRFLSKAQEKYE